MGWCSHCMKYCREERDQFSGMVVCIECGKVIDSNVFTDQPTFVKGSGGESQILGAFVKSVQFDYSESFKRTVDRGRNKIHYLAGMLNIDEDGLKSQAVAFYQMAVERSFTRGRDSDQVAAACLYIACRNNKKPYLLIDFSICLSTNVYVIGAVFLQLCKLLCLQDHPIVQMPVDPSLFIDRFTSELMGNNNRKISKTALNIIASMKRDWMQTGRKPSGLCGAAVYIAALAHGFRFSKSDIVKVVHVCEATLTKRLIEFEDTSSGSLTIEEFNKNAEEFEKEKLLSELSNANSGTMEVLCKHKDKKPHFAGLCESCCEMFIELSGGLHGGAEPPAFQRAQNERLAKASIEKDDEPSFSLTTQKKNSGDDHAKKVDVERCTEASEDVTEAHTANFTEAAATCGASDGGQTTVDVESDICQKSNDMNGDSDGTDNLSDIDDLEVNSYLNNEEERRYKKIIWEELNKEYLQEQAEKEAALLASKNTIGGTDDTRSAQELAAAAKAAVAKSREERRKKRAAEAKAGPAQTAAEATRQILSKKRLSSKINYDELNKLFDEDPAPEAKKAHIESPKAKHTAKEEDEQKLVHEYDEETEANEVHMDGFYGGDEDEMFDCGYYGSDGQDEY